MKEDDYIETFIRENRDKFTVYNPPVNHTKKFLLRLNLRMRHFISIAPHLARVALVTLIIFAASFLVFNNFIKREPAFINAKVKITLLIRDLLY